LLNCKKENAEVVNRVIGKVDPGKELKINICKKRFCLVDKVVHG
jgi:hypothetical protein